MACDVRCTDTGAFVDGGFLPGSYTLSYTGSQVLWAEGSSIKFTSSCGGTSDYWINSASGTGAISYEDVVFGMTAMPDDDQLAMFYIDFDTNDWKVRIEAPPISGSTPDIVAEVTLDPLPYEYNTLFNPQSIRYNPTDQKIYVAHWRYDSGISQWVFVLTRFDSDLSNQDDVVVCTPSTMDADPSGARIALAPGGNMWVLGEATDGRFFFLDITDDSTTFAADDAYSSLWTPCGATTVVSLFNGDYYAWDSQMNSVLTDCTYAGYQMASSNLSVLGIGDWPYSGQVSSSPDFFFALLQCSTPPLRQKQRDDFYNTPRNRYGPQGGGQPASLQESLRQSWGSNTYLLDRELCGC